VSVEAGEEQLTEFWPNWQNEIINGVYPLRRLLHGSSHSAVFLTECQAQNLPAAALRMIPAEQVTLAQLSHWRAAADLSHPHLIRLLDAGLCQLGGRQFLFVVMEYAEQTLSQVLRNRALTADEVQEMLPAALDALAYLHGKYLVQGELKPASFLVVGDQLKLATDSVRPAGEPRASIAATSPYDPPEAAGGRLTPAGDIWALGVTAVEALTQHPPASPDDHSLTAPLPATLDATFADTLRRCLSHDPANRPTAIELQAQLKRASPAPGVAVPVDAVPVDVVPVDVVPVDVVRETPARAVPVQQLFRPLAPAPIIATVLILLVALWAGLRLFYGHERAPQSARHELTAPSAGAKPRAPTPPPPGPVSPPPDQPAQTTPGTSPPVVHEQLPIVPRSASKTIHGHVKVAVLVTVDPSGNVISAILENPGPSAYFAHLAREAARKWTFAPVDNQDTREWLVRFEFTRAGPTAQATPRSQAVRAADRPR
jgi:TonB family protein